MKECGGGEGGPARPFIMKANSVYYKEGCQMTHFFGYGFREYILFWSFIVLLYLPVPVVKEKGRIMDPVAVSCKVS